MFYRVVYNESNWICSAAHYVVLNVVLHHLEVEFFFFDNKQDLLLLSSKKLLHGK